MTNTALSTSRIDETFAALKAKSAMAFMPFIAAGDPSVEVTGKLIQTLADSGADLIELGFPYSDPIADGPVIQSAYTRALANEISVEKIFTFVDSLETDNLPPIIGMVSYAIIFRVGVEQFLKTAKASGFAGLIVPDLPAEEATEFSQQTTAHQLNLIQLLSPTTTPERTETILNSSSGFVYCIAVAGTTGVRKQVATNLIDQLKQVRTKTTLPLAVGFGISQPEHVDPLRNVADGVIVGSGIVRHLEGLTASSSNEEIDAMLQNVGQLAQAMSEAAHQSN